MNERADVDTEAFFDTAAKGWPVGALTTEAEVVDPSQLHTPDGQLSTRQFLSHHPSLTFGTRLTQGFANLAA